VGDNEELTERYTGGEWTVRRPVVTNNIVTLGGLMVIVPAVGLKVRGFRPGRGRWILRAIKIRSTTSLGGKVKPAVPCCKILRHVKNPYSMKDILVGKNIRTLLATFLLVRY
jgi:membrane-associated protease RseP (regulator of RpoE activity)